MGFAHRTLALASFLASLGPALALAAPPSVALTPVASGIAAPVEIVAPPDGTGRLFVLEQGGRIRIVQGNTTLPTPFLDISSKVAAGGEQGLLGLAFHPQYAQNGRFYVFYNRAPVPANGGSDIVVERYQRSTLNIDLADPGSASPVIVVPHPTFPNHNGGKIAFGPDGLLYVAVGDGGGGGDPFNAAQNLADLRGKLLRLDVTSAEPYAIPPSNPFAGTPGARGEVYAYGLRNPWRFSFDRATGDLFIGDVGQNLWEEIDYVPAAQVPAGGHNFGWHTFEGTHCYPPNVTTCALAGHVPPILEYGHDAVGGQSVTGGFRYRGRAFPELRGFYVYGDFSSGRIWAAEPAGGGTWVTTEVGNSAALTTFGEDAAGEIYVANAGTGAILRIGPVDADGDGLSDAFESQHFGSPTAGDAAADSDGDGMSNRVEYLEGRNPLAKDNDVFGDARLFAMQQYRDFLAREGDATGIDFWASRVGGGAMSRAQVIEFFLGSPEFQGAISPVARLYFAYFLRIPDYEGLNFWIGRFRAGMPLQAISDFFASSPEFAARYGALTNAQFVDLLYRNVLGRAPDAGGFAFWTGRLDSGAMTRGQVMVGFSESAEFVATAFSDVTVTMTYVGMLRRSPDQGGFDFWVGQLDGGQTVQGLVDGFLASPEYRARFLP